MCRVKYFVSVFILSRSSQLGVTNILIFFELTAFTTDSSMSFVLGKPSIPANCNTLSPYNSLPLYR